MEWGRCIFVWGAKPVPGSPLAGFFPPAASQRRAAPGAALRQAYPSRFSRSNRPGTRRSPEIIGSGSFDFVGRKDLKLRKTTDYGPRLNQSRKWKVESRNLRSEGRGQRSKGVDHGTTRQRDNGTTGLRTKDRGPWTVDHEVSGFRFHRSSLQPISAFCFLFFVFVRTDHGPRTTDY
jgi:hypothetical protein